jgi:mono/diheme cytochrome c family protein
MNKLFISLVLMLLIYACGGNQSSHSGKGPDGEAIYKKYCILCHGADGKLGLNGSKDISISTLTEAERFEQIKHGKNTMTPFEGILSDEEIKAVAAYSMTLTKQ